MSGRETTLEGWSRRCKSRPDPATSVPGFEFEATIADDKTITPIKTDHTLKYILVGLVLIVIIVVFRKVKKKRAE